MNIIPSTLNVFNPNIGLKTDFAVKYGNYAIYAMYDGSRTST